uniref:HRP4 n=1 Tax=Paratrypanosoma confusum TaxID=1470209 RepID=A0A1B1FGW0_9TRYP|nr:HRP4 [Paratrypanosoma confusum]
MTTLGFDLGAGMTRLALLDVTKQMPRVLHNNLSNEGTATVVSFPANEARCFGETAVSKQFSRPSATVTDLSQWLFSNDPLVTQPREVGEAGHIRRTHPAQAAAFFIKSILQFAPSSGQEAAHVCIAVPALAPTDAIATLNQACRIAGVSSDSLYTSRGDEALAVYFHHMAYNDLSESVPQVVAIVDIGASRSSISLWKVTQKLVEKVDVKAIPIGSGIVDAALASHVFDNISEKDRAKLHGDVRSFSRLLHECKKAKEILSTVEQTRLQLEALKGDVDVDQTITRAKVEELATPLVSGLREIFGQMKKEHNLDDGIRVEAVGGGWRSVCVSELIKECFGISRIGVSLDANLAVAEGCAILAAVRDGALGGENRHPIHQVELVNFEAFEDVADALSTHPVTAEAEWLALEEKLAAADRVIRERLEAINTLDTLVLQTLGILQNLGLSREREEQLEKYLHIQDGYLREDCNGDSMEAIVHRVDEVRRDIARDFPEVEGFYEAQRVAQQKKDEELARLSILESEDKELKSDPQRLRVAQQRREQGQALFKQECWAEAQTRFVQALSILGQLYDPSIEETKKTKDEISLSCHLNIASCSVKLGIWRNAVNNCTKALEIQPDHPKALFRRGQALAAMKEYEEAILDLEKASRLSGGDAAVTLELQTVKAHLEAHRAKEKKMFAKMFA